MMNISEISIDDLKELLLAIPKELERREVARRAHVLEEVNRVAAENGFSIDDLLGKPRENAKKRGPASRQAVEPKYAKIGDPSMVWAGRGRKPTWVTEYLSSGGDLKDLLIAKH